MHDRIRIEAIMSSLLALHKLLISSEKGLRLPCPWCSYVESRRGKC